MVSDKTTICPACGGGLYFYGTVKRIQRKGNGIVSRVYIQRLRCCKCGKEHRALPSCVLPYKHYEAEIIQGFVNGLYSSEDLRFEDFPSEATVRRWKNESARIT